MLPLIMLLIGNTIKLDTIIKHESDAVVGSTERFTKFGLLACLPRGP